MKNLFSISTFIKTEKAWVLLDQFVFSATSFLTTVILARTLGIYQFGQYSSVIIYLFLLLSISNALVVGPFQVLISGKPNKKKYLSSLIIFQIIVCSVLALLTGILFKTGLSIVKNFEGSIAWIFILLFGFLLQDFFRRIFLAIQKAKEAFVIDLVSSGFQLLWLLIAAHNKTLNLQYSLFIIAVTYIPSVLLALYFVEGISIEIKEISNCIKLHFNSGRWLLITSFLQWWSNNFLVAASGFFLGVRALGALRLAQTLFGVLNALLQVMENYALPAASKLYQDSTKIMKEYLQRVTKLSFVFLAPIVLITILLAKQIFILCGGQQYADYAYVLQGMAILYLVIFIGYPVRIAIRVFLMNRDFFIAYCFSFLFSLLIAKYLIMHWQLIGVIVALILNQLIMLGYWQSVLARKKFILWKS